MSNQDTKEALVIARSPMRIPLGGGGTDLPSYYTRYGSRFVSAAIDKYVYVIAKQRTDGMFRVCYSVIEETENPSLIKHPIVREALKFFSFPQGVEIVSCADIVSCSGMGTSGAFSVALIGALAQLSGTQMTRHETAELACRIEIDILKEPVGKQDQYISCFGGISAFAIDTDGNVNVEPLDFRNDGIGTLADNMLVFFTGDRRSAAEVLRKQNDASKEGDTKTLENLTEIKRIGCLIKEALQKSDFDEAGRLMHTHWQVKKGLSSSVSKDRYDVWYQTALEAGALGGKIMGAGGGGFFLFYVPAKARSRVCAALAEKGLNERLDFAFDFEGLNVTRV